MIATISCRKTTREDLEHAEELGQELWEVRIGSREVAGKLSCDEVEKIDNIDASRSKSTAWEFCIV